MASKNCLEGLYHIHEELGSGGFGKVKLATHILTGEKVAIKIIDKRAVGEDLPRITTELDALKHLSHQNICRLYQYIETEEKFYIVMEYCNGGEMFDYIVKKERLEESEARHFFRQLVQAMAYVHSLGFAHRDLKPENLLLKEDLQLKVIDFGLCAKPRNGLNRPLDTCCGSPAYAAPEIIQNLSYFGNEADVWSMGVLLYALLCGSLPFEDDNLHILYKKITSGIYYEPVFLSPLSKDILRAMLQVNPKFRITLKELLSHPWLTKSYRQPLKWNTIYDKSVIDEEVAREMAFFYGITLIVMIDRIKEWRFDYLTATYLIMLQKKEKKQIFTLPIFQDIHQQFNKLNFSPTIHASLERDLNYSKEDEENSDVDLANTSTTYLKAMYESSGFTGFIRSPLRLTQPPIKNVDVRADQTHILGNKYKPCAYNNEQRPAKENERPASMRARGSVSIDDCENRIKTIYATPRRAPLNQNNPIYNQPPMVNSSRNRARSNDRRQPITPVRVNPIVVRRGQACNTNLEPSSPVPLSTIMDSPTTESSGTHAARSRQKEITPRLRQRIYASLERKAEKVFDLLTPRRLRNEGPTRLKSIKTMVNVSITSSKDPEKVRDELLRILEAQGISAEVSGWKISGRKRAPTGGYTTVELEIVMIESMDYVGVKRRRINGDAFLYKRVCEEVLRLAGI
uniref:non-specific serine/threonine protein kinase n=1 Tax=Acrobeloides nanus TaxID=290746 RepID=A0A914C4Y1_9BILA